MRILEFIIKLNNEQIGLLKFDSEKHSHDEAMRLLEWYVNQELPASPQVSGGASTSSRMGEIFRSSVTDQESMPPDVHEDASRNEQQNNLNRNYLLINKRAANREHAAKYNRKILNGNMVATLVALCKVGGKVEEARDLLVVLRDDTRFNSNSTDEGTSNIRNGLKKLESLKLVKKSDDGSHNVTEAGWQISKDFDVPPKKELVVSS